MDCILFTISNRLSHRNFWKRLHTPLSNENGIALILSIFFLITLGLLSYVSTRFTSSDLERGEKSKQAMDAFYIADAGIEHAKFTVKPLSFDDVLAAGGVLDLDGSGNATVSFNGGNYTVQVSDNDDGDSDTTQDSDGIIQIVSTGIASDGTTKQITVLVKKFDLRPLDFPAAVSLVDPDGDIEIASNATYIEGNAKNYDPDPPNQPIDDPTCADKNGVATMDSSPDQTYQNNADDNITGTGGTTPNILTNDFTFTLQEIQEIRNAFLPLVTTTYNGDTSISAVTLGTTSNPTVTYADNSLTISGNSSGAGILIVNKDLNITGSLVYQGVVLIGICDTCPGRFETGIGGAEIYGAIIVANPTSDNNDEARIKMTGSANVYFSCDAIANATNLASETFTVVSWKS
jgi:hypothetical protein